MDPDIQPFVERYRLAVAFYKEFEKELGEPRALSLAQQAFEKMMIQAGKDLAKELGDNSLEALAENSRKKAAENEAMEVLEVTDRHLASKVKQILRDCEGNRLVEQLSRCALEYHCFAAKNAFYRRWECPLPTSPACNADCIGCLSSQPSEGCQASHERIAFVPTVEEVTQVALPHLQEAEDAIVSFGQGCEGEPLLQVDLLETSIATLRDKTDRGTINLNTNGSIPRFVERLCRAGLDSIRITLNSTHPELYNTYFKPRGYEFGHVVESIARAKERGIFTGINLLVFPGLTDQKEEVECLASFIRETNVDMVQARNLNIDPDLYLQALGCDERRGIGIPNMLNFIREKFPHLVLGYFNRTRETFSPNPPRDFSQSLG